MRYAPRTPSVKQSLFLSLLLVIAISEEAAAHGETARGGGSANAINAVGGEIGTGWTLGLRLEVRDFELFSDQQLTQFVEAGEDVHQHSQEMSAFISVNTAIHRDIDLTLVLPFNAFRDFREAELGEDGMPHIVEDDFSGGVGDMVVVGRYRFLQRNRHHLGLLGGIKIPTGMNRQTDNDGERLGTHNQPGSGSIDFQLGLGYNFSHGGFGLTANVLAHVRTAGVLGYHAGNLLQTDLALSYRLGPVGFVAELNYMISQRDVEYDEILLNTGIHTLYVSPGLMFSSRSGHTVFATASIPVFQDLPGIQNAERVRAGVGYFLSFGGDAGRERTRGDDEPHDHSHSHRPERHSHPHRGEPHHHRSVDSEPTP